MSTSNITNNNEDSNIGIKFSGKKEDFGIWASQFEANMTLKRLDRLIMIANQKTKQIIAKYAIWQTTQQKDAEGTKLTDAQIVTWIIIPQINVLEKIQNLNKNHQ